MPRALLPEVLSDRQVVPVKLNNDNLVKIAKALNVSAVSMEAQVIIKHYIGAYLATEDGSKSTTKANVLRLLRDISSRKKRVRENALKIVMQNNAAVDSETQRLLAIPASNALAGKTGALAKVQELAKKQYASLSTHPQIKSETEPFRLFCSFARKAFIAHTGAEPNDIRKCREFLFCLFQIMDINYKTYVEHPERLDELMLSEIPSL